MKGIARQLENRHVIICPICKENPMRQGLTTCSNECSKIRRKEWGKAYQKTEKCKAYNRAYQKTEKCKAYHRAYNQRPEIKAHSKAYFQRPDVKARRNLSAKEYYHRKKKERVDEILKKTKKNDFTMGRNAK